VERLEELLRLPELLVDVAERRAAVAGDEAGGVQAGGFVAHLLHHRQAHQRLDAGHPRATGCQGEFVVQTDIGQYVRHGGVNRRGPRRAVRVSRAAALPALSPFMIECASASADAETNAKESRPEKFSSLGADEARIRKIFPRITIYDHASLTRTTGRQATKRRGATAPTRGTGPSRTNPPCR